jgi:hypothetical protein
MPATLPRVMASPTEELLKRLDDYRRKHKRRYLIGEGGLPC